MPETIIPVINISPLLQDPSLRDVDDVIDRIRFATQQVGFMYITGHGVPVDLQNRLKDVSARFFALSQEEKSKIDMVFGGKAWRGYFKVGDELTSGVPDQKEGIYFGTELPEDHALPLHGPNLWPEGDLGAEMKEIVLGYLSLMQQLGSVLLSKSDSLNELKCIFLGYILMQAMAKSLGIDSSFFEEAFTDPTLLFRIFNYPPHNPVFGESSQAVGEHTDYGYLTILCQDSCGGLQVRGRNGQWIDAPYIENTFVINLGDALEHCTGGLLRATPHRYVVKIYTFIALNMVYDLYRVLQRAGASNNRLSFPFFYDPNFRTEMKSIMSMLSPKQREMADANRYSTCNVIM